MRKFIFCVLGVLIVCGLVLGNGQVFEKEKLFDSEKAREFTGKALMTIAFPIGGLGTGNITLGGRGEIRELEIFNRPDKGRYPDFTFFSIWAREDGKQPVAKILERRLFSPYVAWMGIPRNQLPGVSRFEEVIFKGEYPSDQLLGQYLAHAAGLGYILPQEHVDKAMKSIFAYNFLLDLSLFSNVQRVYALNKEAGLLLCSWPMGKRPALPFVYSDEVWTGIEYQVAASLIYSGHIDEFSFQVIIPASTRF